MVVAGVFGMSCCDDHLCRIEPVRNFVYEAQLTNTTHRKEKTIKTTRRQNIIAVALVCALACVQLTVRAV